MSQDRPSLTVVVPTYWTWPQDRPSGPIEAVFDHPTPLDEAPPNGAPSNGAPPSGVGTLPRLLDSLSQMDGPPFSVLILTATAHPDLEIAAQQQVAGIVAPFRECFPITQFAASDLAVVHERMVELGLGDLAPLFSLNSYPGVRNCQLLVPHVLGTEVIVALDDDEIVRPDYLTTTLDFVGQEHQGKPILGLGGPYLDSSGSKLLPEGPATGNIFLDKSAIMNAGTRDLEAKPDRLVQTPVALGGNMVFHRDLFTQVSFDPFITRGEDIDYLINAALRGFRFWFDKQLVITHLPPEASHGSPAWSKLRQDVLRFIYEREKLHIARIDPSQFDPYPGRFLREDVDTQAIEALRRVADAGMEERFGNAEDIVALALRRAAEKAPHYFAFAREWLALMTTLGEDVGLRRYLRGKASK